MDCKEPGCNGSIEDGVCQSCGAAPQEEAAAENMVSQQAIIGLVRSLLEPKEVSPDKQILKEASNKLKSVVPYNYDAWRLHADLLLNAIHQLETRQLQPDGNFTLLAIPLREDDLRDAAESALRQCARFAGSAEKRIALIDEANRARRQTWF
jgi:hypothetical protein